MGQVIFSKNRIMRDQNDLEQQLRNLQRMASLGVLSAGIAHEIQNPLNFVINFAKMSATLARDLKDIVDEAQGNLSADDADDLRDIADSLATNMAKIQEHGERASSIIQGILLISRGKQGERLPMDIPRLLHEYTWLSYHAMRAKDKTFNVTINEIYPDGMPRVMVIPQDFSRAVINVMNNACYAVRQRSRAEGDGYAPTINVSASCDGATLTVTFCDNGEGISDEVKQKLFKETVTTKPIGEGTGLGMQITHDIITKEHNGEMLIDSTLGQGTTITFLIPCK